MARACEQIHRYLRHYPYSAYLKDRRTDFRDVIMGLSPGTRFDHGKTEKKLLDLQRRVGSSAGLLTEVIDFLKDKNVETHFQPIVLFSKEKKVFAYEALSRFQRADGSFVEPIRMFQAAREANLIKEFDILCALTAMQNAAKIPGGIKLFVNLNRETLIDSDALAQIWNFEELEPERLVIEITEQSLMRELAQLNESIQSLRGRGIQIALDDAGGGSVSLREAAELKPDYAKFDQSLVQGVAASEMKQKILSSLIVFFKGIGSQTVAEGIETAACRAPWAGLSMMKRSGSRTVSLSRRGLPRVVIARASWARSGVNVRRSCAPASTVCTATAARSLGCRPSRTKRCAARRAFTSATGLEKERSKRNRMWRRATRGMS